MPYLGILRVLQGETVIKTGFREGRKNLEILRNKIKEVVLGFDVI